MSMLILTYPGLSLRALRFNPYVVLREARVRDWTKARACFKTSYKKLYSIISQWRWNVSIRRTVTKRNSLHANTSRVYPFLETLGQLVGAGKSLNGRKNSGEEKLSFSRPFGLLPAPTNCPWVSEHGAYPAPGDSIWRCRETDEEYGSFKFFIYGELFQK